MIRHTPLRHKTPPGRVTGDVRRAVLLRDGACVLARLQIGHQCADMWRRPHASTDLDRLSIEHVKDAPMMGRRAPSDPAHMVALCFAANLDVPSKATRQIMRAYLATLP